MLNLNLTKEISTKTYYQKNGSSFGFIFDEKNHIYYLLKGKISDIWDIIVSTQNYATVNDYSRKHNIEKETEEFLAELKHKHILETDKQLHVPKYKYLVNCIKDTNTKVIKYFTLYLQKFIENNNLLDNLTLQLNYSCNLYCRHCFNPKNLNHYKLSFDIVKQIIDEAYDLGITTVMLTGGECTVNKDFLKIAKYIRNRHLFLLILTNAQQLYDDSALFDELVNIYPHTVYISLYSMDSNLHDNITKVKGSHFKTLAVIKKLIEKNVNVSINSPQLSYNIDSHIELRKFAKEAGAEIHPCCGFINNKNNHNINAKLSYEEIQKFHYYNICNNILRPEFKKNDNIICPAGTNQINIAPNLDITPCNGFTHIFGNYNFISLKEVWQNIIPNHKQKFRNNNLTDCFKYEYCKFCQYCPLLAMYDTNCFLKKSQILCEDAKAYYNAFLQYNSERQTKRK